MPRLQVVGLAALVVVLAACSGSSSDSSPSADPSSNASPSASAPVSTPYTELSLTFAAPPTQEQIDQTRTVLTKRLQADGYTADSIGITADSVTIRVPGKPSDATLTRLVAVGQFTLRGVTAKPTNEMCAVSQSPMHLPTPDDPTQPINACSSDGGYLHLGPAAVTSEDIGDVTTDTDNSGDGTDLVLLKFTARGTQGFAHLSTELVNNPAPRNGIAFVVDGLVLSNPYVQAPIMDGYAAITGLTSTQARHLSSALASGPLPLELTLTSSKYVDAS